MRLYNYEFDTILRTLRGYILLALCTAVMLDVLMTSDNLTANIHTRSSWI